MVEACFTIQLLPKYQSILHHWQCNDVTSSVHWNRSWHQQVPSWPADRQWGSGWGWEDPSHQQGLGSPCVQQAIPVSCDTVGLVSSFPSRKWFVLQAVFQIAKMYLFRMYLNHNSELVYQSFPLLRKLLGALEVCNRIHFLDHFPTDSLGDYCGYTKLMKISLGKHSASSYFASGHCEGRHNSCLVLHHFET